MSNKYFNASGAFISLNNDNSASVEFTVTDGETDGEEHTMRCVVQLPAALNLSLLEIHEKAYEKVFSMAQKLNQKSGST